ncbi:TIGR02300 family protein [Brevundimonas sp. LjRoot202]|uniref:TIGR02300 family protein n=1 Tax=Brevundimonas sp. LjRoot202 TaxID=3342281 RepID=UPI003ECCB42F
MANPELGQKQVCPNCQAKFYDLGRRPAHCPKCATDFDPEEALKLRNRRGRPAGYAADETPEEDAEDQVVKKAPSEDEDEEEEAVATPEIDEEGHEPILTPDDDDETPVDPTEESGMGEASDDDDVLADDDDDDSVPFIEDEDDDSFDDDIVKPGKDED